MHAPHTLILPAPAKLNLFLHITGRRSDGYHDLQTLFQLLDYGDKLSFSNRSDGAIQLSSELANTPAEHNLVYRAAKLLQQETTCSLGADIQLEKILPMGAGLGGGSSDAATTLVGLNHLWQTDLSLEELARLGVQLGADVPVFVLGQSAWAEGIGEQLSPVELPEKWYLVLIPPCHISTAEIFNSEDLTRNTSPIKIAAFFEGGGRNDCQSCVEKRYPEVAEALHWLAKYNSDCQLTGTGSAIFAGFSNHEDARRALADSQLPSAPTGLQGFIAKGVNRSPLHTQLPGEL